MTDLVKSRLMTEDEVQAVHAALPRDRKPPDAASLAAQLVTADKLTPYQAQQLLAGQTDGLVLGNYVILDKLGQGGMGLVFKAEHRRMERLVALKVLSPAVVQSPDAVRRFQREVKAAARLTHPNIVVAYDADEAGGTHFLVMEYVDGTDLSSLVKQHGPLPLDQALDCILQAARGLQYAHEHGVVHRDIKPGNLLLDRTGTVKVLDMGLARLDSAGPHQDELTGSGQIMGTVDYMAPEQAVSTKHADQRADIYSLGLTLWYLLTGRPAYPGQTAVEKLMAHQTAPIPALRDACPGVPSALEAAFTKLVAKTPEARYQTMAEVIADLEQLLRRKPPIPAASAAAVDEGGWRKSRFLPLAPTEPVMAPAPAIKTAAAPEVANRDVTMDLAAPQVGTDPHTEQSLPSAPVASHTAKQSRRPPRPPWSRDWRKPAAAGAAALLLVLLGVWVVVRDKHGREVGRIQLPEGGSVTQEQSSDDETRRPSSSPRPGIPERGAEGEGGWNLPPGAPPPAIAPFDAAKAKEHQAAWAKHLGVPVEMENSIGMRFMLIPPGEFDMGSTEEEIAREREAENQRDVPQQWYLNFLSSEVPRHRVRITRAFYLGMHEVTQAEYQLVMETNPSAFSVGGTESAKVAGIDTSSHPVEMVLWNESLAFCERLAAVSGEKTSGRKYRLPTEAEWEYACRAGTTTKRFCGDDDSELAEYAWYRPIAGMPHPVGELKANSFGLFDTCGNVWEWCCDGFQDSYYNQFNSRLAIDPQGPLQTAPRILRGGCWNDYGTSCRSAIRYRVGTDLRSNGFGFRVVLDLLPIRTTDRKSSRSKPSSPPKGPRPNTPADAVAKPPLVAVPWNLPPGSPSPAIAPFDAAKAKEYQAAWAKHLGVLVELRNSIGMRFALIPPGEFLMGSTDAEVVRLLEEAKTRKTEPGYADRLPSEAPQHRVRITHPFCLGVCEVTQAEYEQVAGSNPSQYKDDPRRPVEMVAWDEASAFCRKLGELAEEQRAQVAYRLPTEAEWEYACRAGTASTWYATDAEASLEKHAWFSANAGGTTHPVGQKTPNAWGLFDMHGNVWEWCQDRLGDRYYATSPMDDPTGPPEGLYRVVRGGSWSHDASNSRSAFRGYRLGRGGFQGFRVVRQVPSAAS